MINIENLTVKFDKTVIKDFSVFLPSKGVYCIFAPSGVGKTTLLNAIAGLVKYSGKIDVLGKISYLFQEDRLFNWLTVKQNIMIIEPDPEKVEKYAEAFGVNDFINEMPQELSGGMRRRVGLVRTLAFDADVFLLDEPFNGLDEENVKKVYEVIKEISKEKLVLLVTHNEQDAINLNAEKILL